MKTIYSRTVGGMIPTGFKRKLKNSNEYRHYTWNESDAVYWADDVDDRYYFYETIPETNVIYD
jgi:hypothetical protein